MTKKKGRAVLLTATKVKHLEPGDLFVLAEPHTSHEAAVRTVVGWWSSRWAMNVLMLTGNAENADIGEWPALKIEAGAVDPSKEANHE